MKLVVVVQPFPVIALALQLQKPVRIMQKPVKPQARKSDAVEELILQGAREAERFREVRVIREELADAPRELAEDEKARIEARRDREVQQ